jgi:ribonuclease HI
MNNLTDHEILVLSDSQMMVQQMNGHKNIDRGGGYVLRCKMAKLKSKQFSNLSFKYIPREENTEANMFASKAMNNVI